MENQYILGIDVGTSGAKCIIIDSKGHVISSATETYPIFFPQAAWSEQEPADWYKGVINGIRSVIAKSGIAPDKIKAVGLSGQMHGLTPLNAEDKIIRRAILWNDQRTEKECEEIISGAGGLNALLSYTNNTMLPGFTGGKILWLKKHEPANYEALQTFLMPKDYIRFMLTGVKATDVSDASGTGFFDVQHRQWNWALIEKTGLKKEIFPKVFESNEITGAITKEAADACGLMAGTPVFGGGGDAVIQSAGMGIVEEGVIGIIIGTSGVASMALNSFGENKGGSLQYFCGNEPGKYIAFGCQLSSGGAMEWFKSSVYPAEASYREIDEQASLSPSGSKNLYFLPYLTGERSPFSDPDARGAFIGLSLMHGKGDLARAVMEGVSYGLRQIFDLIRQSSPGLKPKEIICSGGGSKSLIWRQILADIFDVPVKTLKGAAEGGAYGAALVAGVGMGIWQNLNDAAKVLETDAVILPVAESSAAYQKYYAVYNTLYTDLKDAFKRISNT